MFHSLFTREIADPQCGFKAISREVRDKVLLEVENDGFFFDTELIMRVVRAGYKVKEVPVKWIEGSGTSLKFTRDIPRFLKGMFDLYWKLRN